ncbi:uncharacterized protein CDV56_100058, partial [Aspergillus thermomutatus]
PRTNGFISLSSPTSRRPARRSSPSPNTPTPQSPPIPPARSGSWSAARTPTAMSASPSAPGPARRRSVCAATTTRTFTGPASFYPTLPARLWMR